MKEMHDVRSKVAKRIDEKKLLWLAKSLCEIRSYGGQESECARFLASFMKDHGFDVELQKVSMGRVQVIARIKGHRKDPTVMFNGHLDVDPPNAGWTVNPWKPTKRKQRLYGAGLVNMKAGVTAMVAAGLALRASTELRGDLIIAAVVGELEGGTGTLHFLKQGRKPDFAIVTEPTGLRVSTIQAGVTELNVYTLGRTVHVSSRIKGVNAIEKMAEVIQVLRTTKLESKPRKGFEGLPVFVLGAISGGQREVCEKFSPVDRSIDGMTPDLCTLAIDARYPYGMTEESVKKAVEGILEEMSKTDPELKTKVELRSRMTPSPLPYDMPPMSVPEEDKIVQTIKRNHNYVTGANPRVGAIEGVRFCGTDANHLFRAGIPSVVYGPGDIELMGKPDEYVELKDISTCAKVLALTALEICGMQE